MTRRTYSPLSMARRHPHMFARMTAKAMTPLPADISTETQRIESVPGSARQWVRFVGIPWRTDRVQHQPRRERRDSRFGDLTR